MNRRAVTKSLASLPPKAGILWPRSRYSVRTHYVYCTYSVRFTVLCQFPGFLHVTYHSSQLVKLRMMVVIVNLYTIIILLVRWMWENRDTGITDLLTRSTWGTSTYRKSTWSTSTHQYVSQYPLLFRGWFTMIYNHVIIQQNIGRTWNVGCAEICGVSPTKKHRENYPSWDYFRGKSGWRFSVHTSNDVRTAYRMSTQSFWKVVTDERSNEMLMFLENR